MKIGWTVLSLLIVTTAEAQFAADAYIGTMHDDNIGNNMLAEPDNISTLSGTAQYAWEGERWETELVYAGSYEYFTQAIERSRTDHAAGVRWSRGTGAEGENVLTLGGEVSLGLFHDGLSFYDHRTAAVSASYKHFVADDLYAEGGYDVRAFAFMNAAVFSFTEHRLHLQTGWAAGAGTTLILRAEAGAKYYAETLTGTDDGKGWLTGTVPDVAQAAMLVRVGQRLGESTGLSATLHYQHGLNKRPRYLVDDEGYLIADDELFDDQYGYEGLSAVMMFTHYFSETFQVRATGSRSSRAYLTLPAYDVNGAFLSDRRSDDRYVLTLALECGLFGTGALFRTAVDLIDQRSNDPYYTYKNTAVSAGIALPF